MASAASGIPECLPWLGNRLPVVAVRMQSQFQNPERIGVPHFTVRHWLGKNPMAILSARTHNEFANAVGVIKTSVRVLGRKPFVILIMAVDHNVCAGPVECLPQRFHSRSLLCFAPELNSGM
jgi:hypothetical protein